MVAIGTTTTSDVTSLIAVLSFKRLSLEDPQLFGGADRFRICRLYQENAYVRIYGIRKCASIDNQVGARRRAWPRGSVRPLPSLTVLIPTITHPPHNFIGSSTVTLYHVSGASYNRILKFLTLPIYLPSSHKVLPKADQERPSRSSTCLSVAGLRLHYRHHHHPSKSSSRI